VNANPPELETPERFRRDLGDALVGHAETYVRAPLPRVAHNPRRPTRRLMPAAGAIAVLAAATVAFLSLVGGGGVTPQAASAATVLRASAQALDRGGPGTPLARGQYYYTKELVRTRYADLAPHFQFVGTSINQAWVAADGSGRDDQRVLSAERLTPSGPKPMRRRGLPWIYSTEARLTASARPFNLINVFPGVSLSYAQLRGLPTNPSRLSGRIDAVVRALHRPLFQGLVRPSSNQARAAARFLVVRSLGEAPAPPQLLAAAYRVLAGTPGLRLVGSVHDSVGRAGTGIAVRIGAGELGMVVDPSTGALLETYRTVLYRSPQFLNWPPGLLSRATFVSHAVVRSLNTP
jgi:hypothetical protein